MTPDNIRNQPRQQVLHTAMLEALRGRAAGRDVQELWPAWRDATGLPVSSLHELLNGRHESLAARAAYAAMAAEASGSMTCIAPRMGRIARLTCNVMIEMRAAAAQGVCDKELAQRYRTTATIAREIVEGRYHTSAMKQALEQEQAGTAPKHPS